MCTVHMVTTTDLVALIKKPATAGFFYACVSLPGEGKSKQSLTLKYTDVKNMAAMSNAPGIKTAPVRSLPPNALLTIKMTVAPNKKTTIHATR